MNGEKEICLTVIQEWVIDFLFNKVSRKCPFIKDYCIDMSDRYIGIIFKVDYGEYGYDSIQLDDRELVYNILMVYGMFPPECRVECDGGYKWLNIFYECWNG